MKIECITHTSIMHISLSVYIKQRAVFVLRHVKMLYIKNKASPKIIQFMAMILKTDCSSVGQHRRGLSGSVGLALCIFMLKWRALAKKGNGQIPFLSMCAGTGLRKLKPYSYWSVQNSPLVASSATICILRGDASPETKHRISKPRSTGLTLGNNDSGKSRVKPALNAFTNLTLKGHNIKWSM